MLGGDGLLATSPDGGSAYEAPYPPSDEKSVLYVYDRDPATGSLVQKSGTAGCIADRPRKGCQTGRDLHFVEQTRISPDGKNVYVSAGTTLAIFDRDPATGELTQKAGAEGCINLTAKATARTCSRIKGLGGFGIGEMAISPDGRQIYAATARAIIRFDRDPSTGTLTLARGHGARIPAVDSSIVVSTDGKNLYAFEGRYLRARLQTYARDPETGALSAVPGRTGCISEKGAGGCRYGRAIFGSGLIISPDGHNLYSANSNITFKDDGDLLVFDRLPDGTLAQKQSGAGCLFEGNLDVADVAGCRETSDIESPSDLGIGPDGKTLFVEDAFDPGIHRLFARHPSGRLTPIEPSP